MKNYKKIFTSSLLILCFISLLGMGCSKFLDVNDNPNNPDNADPNLLLPSSEAAIGVLIGNSFQIYGSFLAQYWTQSPSASQYKSIDQYAFTNNGFNYPWLFIYRSALENLQLIIDKNDEHRIQYTAISYILKAYTLQVATDAFGDVPVSDALKGAGSPVYDKQEAVYDSVFSYLEKGRALLDNSSPEKPGSEDLIFAGDMDQWALFANSIELRAYMRLSEIDAAKAKKGIQNLYAENAKFLETDAAIAYSTTGGNQNPLYVNMLGLGKTQNLVASETVISAFVRNKDPRQFALYDSLIGQKGRDTIAYIPQGSFKANSTKSVSPPSILVGGNAQKDASALAPVRLMSLPEINFLQSEAIARGWADGDAKDLFNKGIEASFTADGLNQDSLTNYLASAPDAQFPSSPSDQIKAIITQKYYAMCGSQGFEAWTEWRRTGFPDFLVKSDAAPNQPFPLRFLYPLSEVTTNSNYPGTVSQNTPVWWDK